MVKELVVLKYDVRIFRIGGLFQNIVQQIGSFPEVTVPIIRVYLVFNGMLRMILS